MISPAARPLATIIVVMVTASTWTVAWAVSTSDPRLRGSSFSAHRRHLQSCPTPGGDRVCPMIYRPVTCGDCEYGNACVAQAAGYNGAECEMSQSQQDMSTPQPFDSLECALPQPRDPCPLIYGPVVCGRSRCEYENQCLAESAGYGEDDCEAQPIVEAGEDLPSDVPSRVPSSVPTDSGGLPSDGSNGCPRPAPGYACPAIYAPVDCNGCQYGNECEAQLAGYDTATECQDVAAVDSTPTAAPATVTVNAMESPTSTGAAPPVVCNCIRAPCTCGGTECPDTNPNATCSNANDAVTCQGCEYRNLCQARSAGFPDFDCTSSKGTAAPTMTTAAAADCPVTGPAVTCLAEDAPVVCGSNRCEYGNVCLAQGAGYSSAECAATAGGSDSSTNTTGGRCPAPAGNCPSDGGNPVRCGRDDCQYDTLCDSDSAGFQDSECYIVEIGMEAPSSTEPQPAPAATEQPPVMMAADADCPAIDPATTCMAVYEPVVCGQRCEYNNMCEATSAGWPAAACEAA